MITATIYMQADNYAGFTVDGHAGAGEEGFDIVCAAVSVLTVNTVNSIEAFTEDDFSGEESDGHLEVRFDAGPSERTKLLLDSMVLGLTDIQKSYDGFIRIIFKEA